MLIEKKTVSHLFTFITFPNFHAKRFSYLKRKTKKSKIIKVVAQS